jgi:hypothetical protein
MARREVVEVLCDRCGRTETQAKDIKTLDEPEFEVSFRGQKKKYNDLCHRCRGAVEGYFKQATKTVSDKDIDAPKVDGPAPVESVKKSLFSSR